MAAIWGKGLSHAQGTMGTGGEHSKLLGFLMPALCRTTAAKMSPLSGLDDELLN